MKYTVILNVKYAFDQAKALVAKGRYISDDMLTTARKIEWIDTKLQKEVHYAKMIIFITKTRQKWKLR